jgi:D-beta-D-heptose 7-phosphate kinase/D-beta-D-heptose 1-phosphate adenosyltransferase
MNETIDTQQLTSLRVLIIGESCLDEYRLGSVTRISPEAPVPVIQFKELNTVEGMAANVKNNVQAFNVGNIDLITNRYKI